MNSFEAVKFIFPIYMKLILYMTDLSAYIIVFVCLFVGLCVDKNKIHLDQLLIIKNQELLFYCNDSVKF